MGIDYVYEEGKDQCYEKVLSLFENTNKLCSASRLKKRRDLIELSKRLYKILPAFCWKSEATLAQELNTSARQIQLAKRYLHWKREIRIEVQENGKRRNPVHWLRKIKKLTQKATHVLGSSLPIGWEDLCTMSPHEFNSQPILDQLDVYYEINMPFIPIYPPIFRQGQETICSCRSGRNCESIGKHPAIKFKNLDFSSKATFQKMKSYWKESETAWNIAFLTNDFTVLDIDRRNNGYYSLGLLQEEYGEISKGLTVKTGNGFHQYASDRIKCQVNVLNYSGIDIRSNGGFIIAPFSQHKSGQKYEWQSFGLPESLPEDLLADIGGANYMSPRGETKNKSNFRDFMRSSELIPTGGRDRTLFGFACSLRGRGEDFSQIYSKISEFNRFRCIPPLPDKEIKGIAENVMKYPTNAQKELALEP